MGCRQKVAFHELQPYQQPVCCQVADVDNAVKKLHLTVKKLLLTL
jgi:hypothetical protein